MGKTRAYLRFTAGVPVLASSSTVLASSSRTWSAYGLSEAHAIASRASLRAGVWHEADLVDWPAPESGFPDEFGLPTPGEITVRLREREGRTYRQLDDENQVESVGAFVELVKDIEQDDGSTSTFSYPRQMRVTRTQMTPGELELRLTDQLAQSLDQLYPSERYTADSHPDMIPDHQGRIIPYTVAGANYPARHVPGTIIHFDETSGETWVSFGKPGGGNLPAVYRGSAESRAVVDSGEYTVANEGGEIVAKFPRKQKDSSGRWYVFSADVVGTDATNAADELKRILELHDMTVQAAAHTTAQGLATSWKVDEITCDYGNPAAGESGQRQVRGIVRDLLRILRAGLDFDGDGEAVIVCDQAASSSGEYVNGTSGIAPGSRRCRIHPLPRQARRKTIAGAFGVNPQNPGEPAWTIERAVPTGRAPAGDPARVRYLHHPEGADRLTWYWAMREEYNRRGELEIWDVQRALGDVLTLTHDQLWDGERQVVVRSRQPRALGDSYQVHQYHADLHTYVAHPDGLPADAGDYSPDFSGTNPSAPTDLTIDDSDVIQDGIGGFSAWVEVSFAVPSDDNWQTGILRVLDSSSQAVLAEGTTTSVSSGRMTIRVGGLPVNLASTTINAYMQNAAGLVGPVATTSHSTATDAGNPDAPGSFAVSQDFAQYVHLTWTAPVATDRDIIEIQRQNVTSGSGWQARDKVPADQTHYRDAVPYTAEHQWRARTVDTAGNTSAWVTSSNLTLQKNIDGGHIPNNGITTSLHDDDSVTTEKREDSGSVGFPFTTPNAGQILSASFVHAESKTPIAVGGYADSNTFASVYNADANSFYYWAYTRPNGFYPATVGGVVKFF